jgi:tetratricopeptide (TPR) repeat protein
VETAIWVAVGAVSSAVASATGLAAFLRTRKAKNPRFATAELSAQLRAEAEMPKMIDKKKAWNIPRPSANFVGRTQLLAELKTSVQPGVAALVGLGGIGKTHTARQFAATYQSRYDTGWLVRADTKANINTDYAALAQALNLVEEISSQEKIVQAVRDHLSRTSSWIVIYDNAEDSRLIAEYLPGSIYGSIVITSRNPNWRGLGRILELPTLSRAESIEYIVATTNSSDRANADRISEALGDLPIALEQSAAYVVETGITLEVYSTRFLATFDEARHSRVFATWKLSFDRVARASRSAAQLMNLLAFMAPDRIPIPLLEEIYDSRASLLRRRHGNDFLSALATLRRYSLLSSQNGMVTVHRLVQAAARENLTSRRRQRYITHILKSLLRIMPDEPRRMGDWPLWEALLPHAWAALWHIQQSAIGKLYEPAARLATEMASFFIKARRDYRAAADAAAISIDLLGRIGSAHSPALTVALSVQGDALRGQGRYLDAVASHRTALQHARRASEVQTVDVPRILESLGHDYYDSGHYGAAASSHIEAIATTIRSSNPNRLDLASSLNALGSARSSMGDYWQALEAHSAAFTIRQEILGTSHPSTATTMLGLADALMGIGDVAAARRVAQAALSISLERNVPPNQRVAEAQETVALVLLKLGETSEVTELLSSALELNKNAVGMAHVRYARSLARLAMSHFESHDIAGAARRLTESFDIFAELGELEHPTTIEARILRARIAIAGGASASAIDELTRASEIARRTMSSTGQPKEIAELLERLGC